MSENQTKFLQNEVWSAVRYGQTNRLKALLEDVDKDVVCEVLCYHTGEDGQSTTPLIIAAIKGKVEVVNTLINLGVYLKLKGTVVYENTTVHGATALWCACCWGHFNTMRILVDNGADVNNRTYGGSAPLRPAIYLDRFEIVQYIVEHGADVNAKNVYKHTCLMNACYARNDDIAQYLLTKGADAGAKDIYILLQGEDVLPYQNCSLIREYH